MFHENFFDLESFLNDLYERPDPKTVNINHVFQVKKQSAGIVYRQEFHGEAESKHNYKKVNVYIGAHRMRMIIKKIQTPKADRETKNQNGKQGHA